MLLIKWSEDLSVGVKTMDDQHRELINILNEFGRTSDSFEVKEAMQEALLRLKEYTVFHFDGELELMKKFKYEGYEDHKKLHDEFKEKVAAFCQEYEKGNYELAGQIFNVVWNWLQGHIKVEDKKYVECFKANGVE